MIHPVISVFPLDDFSLILNFKNGEVKKFDMKPYLNVGVFKALNDYQVFKKVGISFDTIVWENDIDFDPAVLYADNTRIE